MTASSRRETLVWDLPTRVFHWTLVVLVGLNLFIIEPAGGAYTVIHFVAGYGVLGLLVFRLVWGFIGSPRSRFADFVRRWPAVADYIGRLRRLDPPLTVGHNPLGGWMIMLLLAVLVVMVGTGLCASGRAGAGPFAPYMPVAWTAAMGEVHELMANLLTALVVVHLAGVAAEWLLSRDNIVAAMWTGRKALPAAAAAAERPVAPAGRAAVLALVAAAIVGGLVAATDFGASRASLRALEEAAPPTASEAPAE